jgi:penicillin-binding protein 1A
MLGDDGIKTVIDYATRLGIKSKIEPYPASALGTADISLYEMIGAYSAFANKGVWTKPIYYTKIATF